MKNYVIGIAGAKNSGKDTVASMINYIFAVGTSRAKYQDWIIKRISLDNLLKDRIIHFADPVKDCLSIMYNIPRECFNDRLYKDETWYCIESNTFIEKPVPNIDYCIGIEELNYYDLNHVIHEKHATRHIIKLRTLMQYFATNVCRDNLADDIWIKSTMGKAIDIAETKGYCIIADVRFRNEANAIRNPLNSAIRNPLYSLYGGVIKLNRNQIDNPEHESENIDFPCYFTIDNDGSLLQLFYNVLDIIQKIK